MYQPTLPVSYLCKYMFSSHLFGIITYNLMIYFTFYCIAFSIKQSLVQLMINIRLKTYLKYYKKI